MVKSISAPRPETELIRPENETELVRPENEIELVRSEREVEQFLNNYRWLMESACTAAGMRPRLTTNDDRGCADLERDEVIEKVVMKYATGKWKYDPSKGVKESTYVYMKAYYTAKDLLGSRVPESNDEWDRIDDSSWREFSYTRNDARFVFREALNRLALECGREQLEILARYVLAEEDRRELARLYSHTDEGETVNADRVSVIKNRWLPRLMAHAKQVVLEDEQGVLKLSPNRIGFLKPYLKWL